MAETSANRTAFPLWAWIIAAALALFTGYLVRQMGVQTTQLADMRRQVNRAQVQNQSLQAQLELSQEVSAAMLSPESKLVKLSPKTPPWPALLVYLNPNTGAVIVGDKVPPIPAAQTLQLWFEPKTGDLVSVAIFRPNADGLVSVVASVHVPVEEIAAFSVTEEPAGGSPKPTSPPLWSAQLK